MSTLSIKSSVFVAITTNLMISVAVWVALYAALAAFMWAWLAFILAALLSLAVEFTETATTVRVAATNASITGAAWIVDRFTALRAPKAA